MTVSFSTQILILAIVPLLFISVCIFCEFAMLLDVYILLFPQEEEVHFFPVGTDVHILEHMRTSKRFLSVIMLECVGNT